MSATPTSHPSTPSQSHQTEHHHHLSHPAHKLLTLAHPNDPTTTTKIFTDKILHKPLLLTTNTTTETSTRPTTATTAPADPNTPSTDKRALRRHIRAHKKRYATKHARPKPLSAREKRQLGIYDLQPRECRYEIYRGLNQLWRRYILEVLGYVDRDGRVVRSRVGAACSAGSGAGSIASADFHGMEIEVVRCVDVGRVGVRGIVVRETRGAVVVVCDEREDGRGLKRRKRWTAGRRGKVKGEEEGKGQTRVETEIDKVRMILKRGTVFRVVIELPREDEEFVSLAKKGDQGDVSLTDNQGQKVSSESDTAEKKPRRQLIFELHGDQLEVRPIERAVKKFKWKAMDYL